MKTVKILGDTLNKVADTSTVFNFRLWNGGQAQDVTGKNVTFVIANDSGYIFDVPAVVDGNVISLDFSNALLKELTPDKYHMEVSVTNKDGDVEVYPSEGAIDFTVGKNLHSTQSKLVPQITFDTVLASVDKKITEYTKTIAKGDKGDPGPKGDMDLSQINVGGRNLLLGTGDWSGGPDRWTRLGTLANSAYRGTAIASIATPWTGPTYMVRNAGILEVGKTYTFSSYVRNTSDTDTQVGNYYDYDIVTPNGGNYTISLPAHTDWTRVSTTFKVIKDPTTSANGLSWNVQNDLTNGKVQFAGYKLEAGNVATDWTPAPEDADNAYVKDTRLASGITDFNSVMGKTWSGKWYKAGEHWSNEPTGASNYLQFEYTPGDSDRSGILEMRDWTTNRHWRRTVSGGAWSNWVELANDANVVHKTGDTMTGYLTAPRVMATDFISGYHNVLQIPDTTTSIIDLINNDFIRGLVYWKEQTFISYNGALTDAPTNDVYSIIKLATRGTARTYVEYSDLSGNVWHTTATENTLNPWIKQANDGEVVHKTGNETIAGDKTLVGNTTLATTTILAGNYGLRVTTSGFQKTTDGKTWVPANI